MNGKKETEAFMIELGFYEKVVKFPNRGKLLLKKLVSLALTVAVMLGWMIFGFVRSLNPGLIIFVAILPALAEYFILTFTDVELEYSINDSLVTLSRIYAKSRRKTVFEAEGKDIVMIAPATEENMAKAKALSPVKTYNTVVGGESDPLWLIVFEGEKGEKYLFRFSAEKDITRILKLLKPSALSYR